MNVLNSISLNQDLNSINYQVCVSDNHSNDNTRDVVRMFEGKLNLSYRKNESNIGMAKNIISSVEMAKGEFIWMIGDDDLLLPKAIKKVNELLVNFPRIDFFYINSFNLEMNYIDSFPQPFDLINLPENMTRFSNYTKTGEVAFIDLINPKVSFDFLGGIFLSVFRREKWIKNTNVLNQDALDDNRQFSHLDNTFPHMKIFAYSFMGSDAYFQSQPLSVNLSGAREWDLKYPLVQNIRIPEGLREYRKNGLSYLKYIKAKNSILSNFIPDITKMYITRENSGYEYIKIIKILFNNCFYPNLYLSILFWSVRRIKSKMNRI